ncbi:MAG: double-strand break repair helicase AddA [Rhodospirillaceae bacterium]|jgi:ATP-dependent helicase/nuclease subunit A|nr:double-strand break repair helicase AddA [Rhodospirillaceae bacterium]MBT4587745.1 double-strand break repair helicase AddA [Rhodospirillaceae bacterium]MBT7266777.1 double-strand break repair helicase AddA [Rhodospirillaceae bacterium]
MSTIEHLSVNPNIQQRQAASPEASVWVSASAGTGKTKVLTDRVLSLLLTGTKPQRILCLTFTRAAAAEMESRIADQLGKWTMAAESDLRAALEDLLGEAPDETRVQRARQLFALVLDTPGGMNIQTIHAFCQSLLGRFPLEAGVPPHFALMDERDAEEMLIAAREELLNRARNGADENLAGALAEVTAHIHETQFPDLLAELTYARGRLRRLIESHGSIDAVIKNLHQLLVVAPDETPTGVIAAASENAALDEMGLRLAIAALSEGNENDDARGQRIQNWIDNPSRSSDAFFDYASIFLTDFTKGSFNVRKTLITKKPSEASPGVKEILQQEGERLERAIMHWRSVSVAKSTSALLILGDALLATYQAQKEAKALLDYEDLILMAGELLHQPDVAPWVLFKLDGGIDHVLVDEAQDTSPDQWRVIEALADEFFVGLSQHETPPTIFAVGDVKQSIYSFQGADPITFGAMRNLFATRAKDAQQVWRPVDLTVSFRSTQAVLQAVDAVFALPEAADGVTLDEEAIHHEAWRAPEGGLVELWPPVEPREADAPSAWKPPVERIRGDAPQTRLAELVAGRIAKMINDKEMLESQGRRIEPGDVMVLVRRRSGFVEDLVRALKELEINVAGVDRMVLTEQMAVMDLLALGQFLLLPEDDLTLACLLKSPLIGLSEEQLFQLAHKREGSLWHALGQQVKSDPDFALAHEELSSLLARVDFAPPFELYSEVLGTHNGRLKLVSRLGPDALDPIAEFLNLALVYEKSHVPSLEGFLHWVSAGEVEIKRDLEQATQNSVRVMTVHGAKGLQAPIVFLPDTLQVPMQGSSLFWPEDEDGLDQTLLWPPRRGLYENIAEAERGAVSKRRDQEYRRLLYVAMTRAEDRLYICGRHTKNKAPEHCWYNLIEAGLGGKGEEIEDDYLATAGETASSKVLRLTSPQTATIDEAQQSPEQKYDDLPDWAFEPPAEDPLPPAPLTPSRPDGEEPVVLSPLESDDGARFKRGRIIHALLQTLPDLTLAKREDALRAYLSQEAHNLSGNQQQDIAKEIMTVLEDATFAPIFGPGSRAEVPLIGEIAGQIMSAQLDRLLVNAQEILVVDFKTNRPPPTDPAKVADIYLRQMAAYRMALAEIYPGREIRCALLWTVGPHFMPLGAEQLAPHEPKGV